MPSASKISVKQQIADNKTIVSQMGQKVIGLDGPKFAMLKLAEMTLLFFHTRNPIKAIMHMTAD